MLAATKITRVSRSRLPQVDFDNLGFGTYFSDHMFSLEYVDGQWRNPEVLPNGPISLMPGNATLHYGQAVFEGLKAFRGSDGLVRVFRHDRNEARLEASCERLCIPLLPKGILGEAIERLIRLDHRWIPSRRGHAFYIRPVVFSDEDHLEVRPSNRFRLLVMTSPVRAYFDESAGAVPLKVEQHCTRSAPGGTGSAKTAGNYAGSLYPTEIARRDGFAQVLWLDGVEHKYVEEVGAMNIFFRINDVVVTPELRGTILPGITRESVLTILRDRGTLVEERRIAIDEILAGIEDGSLQEAFCAGTAAIISPVGKMAYEGREWLVNDNQAGPVTREMYDIITGIQLGELEDRYGWTHRVDLPADSVTDGEALAAIPEPIE